MTNVNYTQMSNQELLDIIQEIPTVMNHLNLVLMKDYPELYTEIVSRTEFLNDYYLEHNKSVPLQARMYCIKHHLLEHPKCQNPNCPSHAKVDWCRNTQAFRLYCSCRCLQDSPQTASKRNTTWNKKYGGHPMKTQEIKEKAIYNNKVKHGGVHSSALPEVKAKVVETNLKRYNTSCTLQNEEVKAKARQTMIERHGAEFPLQCSDIKKKIHETLLKQGIDYPSQSEEWKRKVKETNLLRRGVTCTLQDPNLREAIQEKICQTRRKRHFIISNVGGVDVLFDSNWERTLYEFLIKHNIEFEYHPNHLFYYEYDGKKYRYMPDFKVKDKFYEVKGDQFFRINESTGQEEMFIPWKSKRLTNEEYKWKCEKTEAKHQCMLANNVIILRGKDIENLSIEMFA